MRILQSLGLLVLAVAGGLGAQEPRGVNPHDVALVMVVDRLADSSAVASVERRTGPGPKNVIRIPRRQLTPQTVARALSELTRSRRKHGKTNKNEDLANIPPRRGRYLMPDAARQASESYTRLLANAPETDVKGIGHVQAIWVRLE